MFPVVTLMNFEPTLDMLFGYSSWMWNNVPADKQKNIGSMDTRLSSRTSAFLYKICGSRRLLLSHIFILDLHHLPPPPDIMVLATLVLRLHRSRSPASRSTNPSRIPIILHFRQSTIFRVHSFLLRTILITTYSFWSPPTHNLCSF